MRDYEIMVIFRPELDEDAFRATSTRIEDLITRNGGSLVRTIVWGRRKFAYPLTSQRQLGYRAREGYYVIYYVSIPPRSLVALDRDLRLMDEILRSLTIMREGVELPAADVPPPPLAENEILDEAPETDDLFLDESEDSDTEETAEGDSDEAEEPADTGAAGTTA